MVSKILAQIPGVRGTVKTPGYVGWIELRSMNSGAQPPQRPTPWGHATRRGSQNRVTLTVKHGVACFELGQVCLRGNALPKVVLHFCGVDPRSKRLVPEFELILQSVHLEDFSIDKLGAQVTLSCRSLSTRRIPKQKTRPTG